MKLMVAAALLSSSQLVFADEAPYEFKGLALGSDYSQIQSDKRFACRDPQDAKFDRFCMLKYGHKETIAGIPVSTVMLCYYDDKLQIITINFPSKEFSEVADALKEKYGQGTVKSEEVHNRMGATFQNETLSWSKADATLRAEKYSSKLDTSRVTFQTDYSLEEFARRNDAATKAASKDL